MDELRQIARGLQDVSRLARARLPGGRTLLAASWVVTMRCNAACPFCARHGGPSGVGTDDALRLIDELAEAGCRRVHLTGGEPLVRDDLPKLLDRLAERGISRSINTNGILLAERPEVVARTDQFLVSVDGPPVIHDRFRGEGAFARLERGVDALERAGVPFLITAVLTRSGIDHLDAVFAFAAARDTVVMVQPGTPRRIGGHDDNPERPDPEQVRELARRLLATPSLRERVWNSDRALRALANWPRPHGIPCRSGRVMVRIELDGSLYPCARGQGVPVCEPAPNAMELGLQEAFERLPARGCGGLNCWSAQGMEKGLLLAGHPSVAWRMASRRYPRVRP